MFIDFTEHSELAHRIRQKLKKIEEVDQMKKNGYKGVDLQSNPWSDEYCGRDDCLVCNTSG